jgi:hypothetical protein
VAAAPAVLEECLDGGREVGVDGDAAVLGNDEVATEDRLILVDVLEGHRLVGRSPFRESNEAGHVEPDGLGRRRQRG